MTNLIKAGQTMTSMLIAEVTGKRRCEVLRAIRNMELAWAKTRGRKLGRRYVAERLENGDTLKELLARGRYALFKSPEKWTDSQRRRADMMFRLYPDLKEAYCLSQNLRAIFNKRSTRDSARLNLARWYNRVAQAGFKSFNTIAATFYEHSDEILNFFDNRSTNASAESMNSKIKAFRAKLHGVRGIVKKLCMRNEKLIFAVKTDCDGKESVYRAGGMCSAGRNDRVL